MCDDPSVNVSPLELARFKRLAVRSSDVWQGGVFRLPLWIQERDEDPPYRVRGALWFSTRTGLIWATNEDERGISDLTLALRGLVDFARKYDRELMGRPSRLEVIDATLAGDLGAALDDPDTTIGTVRELPNIRDLLRHLEEHNSGQPASIPLLESPGVTLDGLRAFADAAKRFYEANVWHALDADEDLVLVESPVLDPALRYLAVTGSTPAVRGLTFFPSPAAFEKLLNQHTAHNRRPASVSWILSYGRIDELPFGDVDAWEDHDLPVAGPDAYPYPVRLPRRAHDPLTRPDAARLHDLEAVLRALADSTDDDFDSGRWTRRVETSRGPVDVRLSLPRLLEAAAAEDDPSRRFAPNDIHAMRMHLEQFMRRAVRAIEESGAASAEEAEKVVERLANDALASGSDTSSTLEDDAQRLADRACLTSGRYQRQLAHRALALWPDCADAWLVLGNRAKTPADAIRCYQEAVAAAERAVGPKPFTENAGEFWRSVAARPYLRARTSLAEALDAHGRADDAAAHYREMLRLDRDDRLGVRYPLLRLLLRGGSNDEARALIEEFAWDEFAGWLYAGALVAFRRQAEDADDRLRRALAANRRVPAFLTGAREIPDLPATYAPGSADEAKLAADGLLDAWQDTPGAIEWLDAARHQARQKATARTRRKR